MNEIALYFIGVLLCAAGVILLLSYNTSKLAYVMCLLWTLSYISFSISLSYLRGQPKLVSTEIRKVEVAQVLWAKIDPGKNIYLLLTWKGLEQPLYYSMPWSKELEVDFSQAQAKAAAHNTPLMIRNPFGAKGKKGKFGDGKEGNNKSTGNGNGSQNDEGGQDDTFYPVPPPPEPPKPEDTSIL